MHHQYQSQLDALRALQDSHQRALTALEANRQERARAMLVQLMAYGLPAEGISTGARALGRGGLARLVD